MEGQGRVQACCKGDRLFGTNCSLPLQLPMLQMPSSKGNFDLANSAGKRESIERCKKSREGLNDDDDDEEPSNRRLPHSLPRPRRRSGSSQKRRSR